MAAEPRGAKRRNRECRGAVVRPIRFVGDDEAMVAAIIAGHPGASEAMFDRYSDHVYRVLMRIMGFDDEIGDLLQDVFVEALKGISSIREGSNVKAWLTGIAVHVARSCIRRRSRRRWLQFRQPESVPQQVSMDAPKEVVEALEETYAVLDLMPADERIPFALRFIQGMELTEVARACDVSLATVKRRISRARTRFATMAQRREPLKDWIDNSPGWRDR